MKPDIKIAWATLLFLAALALAMAFSAVVSAEPLSLTDRIVAVVPSIASRKDEPVDARELAEAIASTTSESQWAALELAVMANESALSARIARGEYRDREADSYRAKDGSIQHRAWGLGQLHRNALNNSVWGSPEISTQVSETAKALRRGFYTCMVRGEKLRADWAERTINGYAGRRCDAQWPGLQKRISLFRQIAGRL